MLIFALLFAMSFGLCFYGVLSFYFDGFVKNPRCIKTRALKVIISLGLGFLSFAYNILAIVAFHLFVMLWLSAVLYKMSRRLIKKRPCERVVNTIKTIYKTGAVPILLVGAIFIYGFYNMNNVVSSSYKISSDKLQNDYHIVFISDIHYDTIQDKDVLVETVEDINKISPDIVILGGDITEEDTSSDSMKECFFALGGIEAKYGTYFVYGNHDRQRYSDSPSYTENELYNSITNSGITILKENAVEIENDLLLFGREDYGSSAERLTDEKVKAMLDKDRFVITADHQPSDAENNVRLGSDLVLSGHTHAGQIFPVGLLTIFNGGYSYGEYDIASSKLIVSSGFAGWGFPIRTSKNCEYVVVELSAE